MLTLKRKIREPINIKPKQAKLNISRQQEIKVRAAINDMETKILPKLIKKRFF